MTPTGTYATSQLYAVHNVQDEDKLARLVESMETEGWLGRPILIISEYGDRLAMTGSHRLAAAREAGIDVPVVEIEWADEAEWCQALMAEIGEIADANHVSVPTYLQSSCDDDDKLALLRLANAPAEAIALMIAELEPNNAYDA